MFHLYMVRSEDFKKKIAHSLLCFLFGFGIGVILLFELINFRENYSNAQNNLKSDQQIVNESQSKDNCIISNEEEDQSDQADDTLFIGCNGFF